MDPLFDKLICCVRENNLEELRALLKLPNAKYVLNHKGEAPPRGRDHHTYSPIAINICGHLLDPSRHISSLTHHQEEQTLPLLLAAKMGHSTIVKELLENGAEANVYGHIVLDNREYHSITALWIAASQGHVEVCRILIQYNCNINQRTGSGTTALDAACIDSKLDTFKLLLESGADVNIPKFCGRTPLMFAVNRATPFAEELIARGVDINSATLTGGNIPIDLFITGQTELHCAIGGGDEEKVRLLTTAGATHKSTTIGITPLLNTDVCGRCHLLPLMISETNASQRERRNLWKLLGASLVNRFDDYDGAIECWRKSFEVEVEEEGDDNDELPEPSDFKKMLFSEQKEARNVAGVDALVGSIPSMAVEALLISDRILGETHPIAIDMLRYWIRRTPLFTLSAVWLWIIELRQKTTPFRLFLYESPPPAVDLIINMVNIINPMVKEIPFAQRVTQEILLPLMKLIVREAERFIYEVNNGNDMMTVPIQLDDGGCGCFMKNFNNLLEIFLYLLKMIGHMEEVSPSQSEKCVQPAVKQAVRVFNILGMRNALHLACKEKWVDKTLAFRRPLSKFVVEQLLEGGACANEKEPLINNTPLHVLLQQKQNNAKEVQQISLCLLQHGAFILARNIDGDTCLQLMRQMGDSKMEADLRIGTFINLKQLASSELVRWGVSYDCLSDDLIEFVGYFK